MADILAWFITLSLLLMMCVTPIVVLYKIIKFIVKKIIDAKDAYEIKKYRQNYKPPGVKPLYSETGWIWNEKTQMWDPPAHLRDKKPTYEEWKADKHREEEEVDPKNHMTGEGTYRYDYVHTPSEQQGHFHHTDTNIVVKREVVVPNQKTEEKKPEQIKPAPQEPVCNEPVLQEKPKKGYEDAYEARQILSYNESRNYKTLKEAADKKGYTVQIKMRLADIVEPRRGQFYDKYYEANFRRISQYHVDFTILNDRMKVVAIIELDDNSHDRPDRQERDEKIDSILEGTNIKVIHTRHITPDILDGL